MKVLYFIFVSAGGKGGHFHSLNHITQQMGEINQSISIISFGNCSSPVVEKNPYFVKHLDYSRKSFLKFYFSLFREVKTIRPDIVHFFDSHSFNIFFPYSLIFRLKYVINKCGGPNPARYPIMPNLVLFSIENLLWFQSNIKYNDTKITVIPNRVKKIEVSKFEDYERDDKYFSFIRISRIGKTYFHSIKNGINLIQKLTEDNYNARLFVVGTITEEKEYHELVSISKGLNVVFITDKSITANASSLLYIADAVIGTGRSAIEAASLWLPVLMPSKQLDWPILLTESNYDSYSFKNFTERVYFEEISDKIVYSEIVRLLDDQQFYEKISSFTKEMFKKEFDVEIAPRLYLQFYNQLIQQKINLKVLLTNTECFLRTTFRMFMGDF